MAYLNRARAQALMSEARLDGLILLSPESFYYATAAAAGVATMWRRAGAVAVLVPADSNVAEMAVASDLFMPQFRLNSHIDDVRESPIWVETATIDHASEALLEGSSVQVGHALNSVWEKNGREAGFNRPTTFNPQICYSHIKDALAERGLANTRIGFEASAVSVAEFSLMESVLSGVDLVDASEVIAQLKMVKSQKEIANLRQAVSVAEEGITAVREAIDLGVTRSELAACWNTAIGQSHHGSSLSGSWEYISVGTDPWGGDATVQAGDLVKVDVGCLVDGYTSDTGRTFVVGAASRAQAQLYDALSAGFEAGASLLKPGIALSEVHAATLAAIRAAGIPGYTRGHFGHGLGAGMGSEQWPFIAADSPVTFEPGMVMAFECPLYINGFGGMIVENQLLITDSGHEMMNSLSLQLVEI